MHAPVDVLMAAGDAENPLAAVADFRPHRAAFARAMRDPVRNAAQRHHGAGLEGRGLRQTPRRAAIQPPWSCAKSRASMIVPRGGMVRMASRSVGWIRKV